VGVGGGGGGGAVGWSWVVLEPPLEAMLAYLVCGWWVDVGRPWFVRVWLRAVL
jgi:hypothetical protein